MDLEKVLAEDRVKFETKVAVAETPEEQYKAGISLYTSFFPTPYSKSEQYVIMGFRIDAFMHLCVKHAVCSDIVLHVLRSTVSSADKFINRAALAEYCTTFPSPGPLFTESLKVSDALLTKPKLNNEYILRKQQLTDDLDKHNRTTVRPDRAKVVELEKLCEEYQDWLRRMRLGSKSMDPKNYPPKDELRIRDNIRAKIMDVATPDLLLQMAVQVLQRGEFDE